MLRVQCVRRLRRLRPRCRVRRLWRLRAGRWCRIRRLWRLRAGRWCRIWRLRRFRAGRWCRIWRLRRFRAGRWCRIRRLRRACLYSGKRCLVRSRGHSRARQDLLHNAATQQRKGALCHGFAHRACDGCIYRRLSLWITARNCPGVLQEAHQQLPLLRAENAFIPHQRFRKGIQESASPSSGTLLPMFC